MLVQKVRIDAFCFLVNLTALSIQVVGNGWCVCSRRCVIGGLPVVEASRKSG